MRPQPRSLAEPPICLGDAHRLRLPRRRYEIARRLQSSQGPGHCPWFRAPRKPPSGRSQGEADRGAFRCAPVLLLVRRRARSWSGGVLERFQFPSCERYGSRDPHPRSDAAARLRLQCIHGKLLAPAAPQSSRGKARNTFAKAGPLLLRSAEPAERNTSARGRCCFREPLGAAPSVAAGTSARDPVDRQRLLRALVGGGYSRSDFTLPASRHSPSRSFRGVPLLPDGRPVAEVEVR
mmetsp:Transcript_13134/g.28945  ORF Transcript_13134/g.28945 Transcript_13134/m.28945 type:complete len:236 (+) Transcript_13134:111-818(+)